MMTSNTKVWLQGLTAAAISSLVTAMNGVIVLPDVFNFSHAGWTNTAKLVLVPTISAVCLYLKKSPLPETVTATVDKKGNITNVSGSVEVAFKPKN